MAEFLGELFFGIYHLVYKAIYKVDWSNTHHIEISIGWKDWSTTDFDRLTRLVFLAHHLALRVDLTPSTHQYMRLLFHLRCRTGNSYLKHPTLEDAVNHFIATVSVPEYPGGA